MLLTLFLRYFDILFENVSQIAQKYNERKILSCLLMQFLRVSVTTYRSQGIGKSRARLSQPRTVAPN
jgi:hypothetical protein